MTRNEWLTLYGPIWTDHVFSRELVQTLFTEDAVYRPNVLHAIEQPYKGHDAIFGYLERVVPTLGWTSLADGGVIEAGEFLIMQAWLSGQVEGKDCTEVVCTIYRFAPDGRCCEIRDYPLIVDEIVAPFEGWDVAG
jgi:hypothetical protein